MDYVRMLNEEESVELENFRRIISEQLYSQAENSSLDYGNIEQMIEDELQKKAQEIVSRRPVVQEPLVEEPIVIDELKIRKDTFLSKMKEDQESFAKKYGNKHVLDNLVDYFERKVDSAESVDALKKIEEEYNNFISFKERIVQRGLNICNECNRRYESTFESVYRDENFNSILDIYRDAFMKNDNQSFLDILNLNLNLFVVIKYKEAFRKKVTAAIMEFTNQAEKKAYCEDVLNRMNKVNTLDEMQALMTEFNNNMLIMKENKVLLNPGQEKEIPVVSPTPAEKNDKESEIPVMTLPENLEKPLLTPAEEKPLAVEDDKKKDNDEEKIGSADSPDKKDEESKDEETLDEDEKEAEPTEKENEVEKPGIVHGPAPRKFKVVFRNCTYKIPGYGDLEVEEGSLIHGPLIDPVPLNESGRPKKFTAKVFSGWVDEYGNAVDLSKPITKDMEIRASYKFDRKKALVMGAGAAVGTLAYVADLVIPMPVPIASIAGAAGFNLAGNMICKNLEQANALNKAQAAKVTAVSEPSPELLESIQKSKKKNYWKLFCKTAAAACGISAAVHGIRELTGAENSIVDSTGNVQKPVVKNGQFKGYELGDNKVYRTAADSLNGTNGVKAYAPAFEGDKTYKAFFNNNWKVIEPGDEVQDILDYFGATSMEDVAVSVMNDKGGYLTWSSLADCIEGASKLR